MPVRLETRLAGAAYNRPIAELSPSVLEELSEVAMALTWDEIIVNAWTVKKRGGSYSIARHELKAAMPKEFREMGVTDAVEALNRVLAGNGLIAVLECGVVIVSRIENGRSARRRLPEPRRSEGL